MSDDIHTIEVDGEVGEHVTDLRDEIARLRALLPEGMEDRRIIFEECEVGHGSLRGENWMKNDCPWCQISRLRAENERLSTKLSNTASARVLQGKAIAELRAENERLRAENKVLSKTGDDLVMLLNAVSREIIKRRDEILSSARAALKENS